MKEHRGYTIELNEYPHPDYKYEAVPIEYTGCETIFHGKTIEDCIEQINDYLD